MEILTTGVEILVGAMGLELLFYGVKSLENIIKRGENKDGEDNC
ncbi:hypothetical protein [Butyrivibrio sp. AC2005]|nr:hypothetical protein [Butyrivibrio sp. AC2005]